LATLKQNGTPTRKISDKTTVFPMRFIGKVWLSAGTAYLVGDWNMAFMTFHILRIVTPTDELHHFSEGLGSTTNQHIVPQFTVRNIGATKILRDPIPFQIPKEAKKNRSSTV